MKNSSLEFIGFLNGKYNLEKEYPEKYQQLIADLQKLDRLVDFKKGFNGISFKQKQFAEAIAKELEMKDFDITTFDKKSINEWLNMYIPIWKAKKEEKENVKSEDIPF